MSRMAEQWNYRSSKKKKKKIHRLPQSSYSHVYKESEPWELAQRLYARGQISDTHNVLQLET